MIRVRSSDELMQKTGQGDAYVFSPLNMDTFFKAREMKLRHEERENQIKAKQAKDLENRLTFNPGTATPEHDEEFNKAALEALEVKKNIGLHGDPTGEQEKAYNEKHLQAKQIGAQSKAIQSEMATAHGEIKSNPMLNQTEAYQTLVGLHNNPDGKAKSVTDWKHGEAMTNVYANPNTVHTENLFKTFAKNAGQQMMSIKSATENGDVDISSMDRQVGKFLIPKKDEKGKVIGYQTDKDGNFVFDINDNTLGAVYGTYPNPGAAKQKIESDYSKRIESTGLNPQDYTINEFVADNLKTYISTSTSKIREYQDKAEVKAKDGNHTDKNGATSSYAPHGIFNFTAKYDVTENGVKVRESTGVHEGYGFGFNAIASKGKQVVVKSTSVANLYDLNTATKKDSKNLGTKDLVLTGVSYLATDIKTNKPSYRLVERKTGEEDDEYAARNEEFVAKNRSKYKLKPYVGAGSVDEANVSGDATANDNRSNIDKQIDGEKKSKASYFIPYENVKAQILSLTNPNDPEKYEKQLLYSPAKARVEKLASQYQSEKGKEVKAPAPKAHTTTQPQIKTISRSDIKTKAAKAGYSEKEYEKLLLKNGIKIE